MDIRIVVKLNKLTHVKHIAQNMAPQNRLEKLTFKKLQTNGAYCPLIRNLNGLIRGRAWLANLSKISQENEGQEIIQLPSNKSERHRECSTCTPKKIP